MSTAGSIISDEKKSNLNLCDYGRKKIHVCNNQCTYIIIMIYWAFLRIILSLNKKKKIL